MRQCGKCGSQNLKIRNIKGTKQVWRDYLGVELLCDQDAIVCEDCKNLLLYPKDITALEKNIRSSLSLKVKSLLNRISEHGFTQTDISEAMGITPEFLSSAKMVKNKVLSFSLFNILQIYADHPEMITQYTSIKPSKQKGYTVTLKGAPREGIYAIQVLKQTKAGVLRIVERPEDESLDHENTSLDKSNYRDAYFQKGWSN